jgi:hypothetical protein
MMRETPPVNRQAVGHSNCMGVQLRPNFGRPPRLTHTPEANSSGFWAITRAHRGDIMSTAKQVKEIGPRMEWLAVEDSAGHVWRYKRAGALDIAEPAQVEGHFTRGEPIRAVLVRDADGHVLLHGNGTGMPRAIVVQHVDDPTSPLLSILGLTPKEKYVLMA